MTIHQSDRKGADHPAFRGVSIMDLKWRSCRFPLWSDQVRPDPDQALYCGDVAVDGSPYCACHLAQTGGRYLRPRQDVVGVAASRVAVGGHVPVDSVRSRPHSPGLAPKLAATDDKSFSGVRSLREHYREVQVRLNTVPERAAEPPAPAEPPRSGPDPIEDDPIWWEEIIDAVCTHYGVTVGAVLGPSRMEHLVRARHVVMYLTDILTENSHAAIARALRKDKTAVPYGVSRIEALIRVDRVLAAEVEALRLKLLFGDEQ